MYIHPYHLLFYPLLVTVYPSKLINPIINPNPNPIQTQVLDLDDRNLTAMYLRAKAFSSPSIWQSRLRFLAELHMMTVCAFGVPVPLPILKTFYKYHLTINIRTET